MPYTNRQFQTATPATPPAATDPMVDSTSGGDVQAIKLIDATAGSTTPLVGQMARALSLPTALSTEDAALLSALLTSTAYTTAIGAPETGQALGAGGSGNLGWLSSIRKAITDRLPAALGAGGGLKVDGSGTALPVSATSLPLPALASTAALQTTGNTSVGNIDTKTPALGPAAAALSSPVTLANDGVFASNFGLQADTSATTDTGSFSLIALFKRLLSKLTSGLNIGGFTAVVAPTVTVSTSPAYTAGDCVGGKLTLSGIVRTPGTALLQSLFMVDTSNQKAALELIIFNADPSATTFTDNGALSINAADVSKIVRRISIATTDYVTIDTKAFADISPGGKVLTPSSGTDMYACLVAVGTPTYAATTALALKAGVLQD